MSLFGKLWGRFRGTRKEKARARRLFLEPLEGRQLLAVDLQVVKDGPADIIAGQRLTYTITLRNKLGSEPATNVVFTDSVPAQTTFASFDEGALPPDSIVTEPGGGETGDVTVTIPNLAAGEEVSFVFVVDVITSAPNGSMITNIASATSDDPPSGDPDPVPGDNTDDAMTTVGTLSDSQIEVFADSPEPVNSNPVGQNITYQISVINGGPSDATNPVLTTQVPLNTTFVDLIVPAGWTDPSAPDGSGELTSTAASLIFNQSVQFTLIVKVNDGTADATLIGNMVEITSDTTDSDASNNDAITETTVNGNPPQVADLSITKTDNVTSAIPGQTTLTYTITVSNAGPAGVMGASVTDMFPVQLTNITYTASSPGGVASGFTPTGIGDINDTDVDLPNGSSVVYIVTASISPSAIGTIVNTARVAVPGGITDPTPSNDEATDNNTVLAPQANLTIVKSDSPDPVSAGNLLTYTITVANSGPSDAQNLSFTDMLPAGTGFASFTSSTWTRTDSTGLNENGTVRASLATLAANASSTIRLTLFVDAAFPPGTDAISNTAVVTTTTTDPSPGTTSDTEMTSVNAVAELSITKIDDPDPVNAGDDLTYTITVTNNGPSDSGAIALTDNMSVNTTFVSFTPAAGWDIDLVPAVGSTGQILASNENLAVGATAVFTLVVRADGSTTTVTNQASIASLATDNNLSDNMVSIDTTVVVPPNPDLVVTKSDNPDPVTAGTNLTYTITVTNSGGVAAPDVRLTDVIPANTTFQSVMVTPSAGWAITNPSAGNSNTLTARKQSGMAPLETATFTLVVRVNPSAPSGTIITNAPTATTTGELDLLDNSPTTQTTVQTQANLTITITDSPDPVIAGANLTYTITVNTAGPSDAQIVVLSDMLPAGTTFRSFSVPAGWTPVMPPVGSGGTVSATRPTLPVNAGPSVFVLIVGVSNALPDGTVISNTATVISSTTDPSTPNIANTTTTVRVPQDFGDAPATYDVGASGPARHIVSNSLRMGANVDSETAPQNSVNATGDDIAGVDDEDGVTVPGTVLVNRDAAVVVNASGAGRLDAWIDFNRNGVFDEPSERIATSILLVAGPNTIPFAVPASASLGDSFARFRLSSAGGLGPTGPASDGEVEDYAVGIGSVAPGGIGIMPDPENPGFNMLSITGTAGNDTISVKQLRTHKLLVEVTMNKKKFGPFSMADFRRVVAYAGFGNDTAEVLPALPSSLRGEAGNDKLTGGGGFDDLFGGPGNDTLKGNGGDDRLFGDDGNDSLSGGNGNDLLLGGIGRDTLTGGKHRDVMIGGLGVDSLKGDQGDDIAIGGTTDHDSNRVALDLIMATWTHPTDSFGTRIGKLSGLLNSTTVDDDGSRDRLEGGSDRDWYLDYLLADSIAGFSSSQDRKN